MPLAQRPYTHRSGWRHWKAFAAHIDQPIRAGEQLVVSGWALSHDGRKHFAGTALYNQSGQAVAWAEATWISLAAAA